MGPAHLNSKKWKRLNYLGGGLAIFLLLGTVVLVGYRTRKGILTKCQTWLKSMEKEKQEPTESKAPVKPDETTEPKQESSSQEEESE